MGFRFNKNAMVFFFAISGFNNEYIMGVAKNHRVSKLAKISFRSLKWTVRAETRKLNPMVKIN